MIACSVRVAIHEGGVATRRLALWSPYCYPNLYTRRLYVWTIYGHFKRAQRIWCFL
jgi:hypothetical protein